MHSFASTSFARPGTVLLVATLALFVSNAFAAAQDKIQRWHDNLDRGIEAARTSGKPLFVVFRCVR
jgi:hypothetical protein